MEAAHCMGSISATLLRIPFCQPQCSRHESHPGGGPAGAAVCMLSPAERISNYFQGGCADLHPPTMCEGGSTHVLSCKRPGGTVSDSAILAAAGLHRPLHRFASLGHDWDGASCHMFTGHLDIHIWKLRSLTWFSLALIAFVVWICRWS